MKLLRTFSAKLLVLISIVTCTVALGSGFSVYCVARANQVECLKKKLMTLAATAAKFIDGDKFASLRDPRQHGNAEWNEIAEKLLKFQDTDPEIKFIYTVAKRPDTDSTGIVQFVVDPTPDIDENGNGVIDPEEKNARLGEAYNAGELAPDMLKGFSVPACDENVVIDQWGASLSGYAPIRNSENKVVGIVGTDVMATDLLAMRRLFITQCMMVVGAVLLSSVLVSFLTSWHINKPVKALYEGISEVSRGNLEIHLDITTEDEFQRLADAFNSMIAGLKERAFIRGTLDRYMSKDVVDVLVSRGESFFNTVERRWVTILFSDLRGFTAIAEQQQPEETASILSCYFERMIDAVFRHGGIVDKLTGDGIMALFGTPLDMPKQEEAAILCALDMKRSLTELREVVGMHELNISVGINTGSVVVGNIGSGKTMDYTVVGDAVNVAARLERKTREHETDILISYATAEPVLGRFNLRMIGPIILRGRAEPVIVYSVDNKEVKSG